MQCCIRKMARKNHSAVRNGKQKRFSKIESRVHAKRKPQASRTLQSERPEQAHENHAGNSDPVLAGIVFMNPSEYACKQNSGGPEADAVGKSVKSVTTEKEFHEQCDHDEKYDPENGPLGDRSAMLSEAPEGIPPESRNKSNEGENL